MSDEVTQPIESTEQPEILQAQPAETLPLYAPATAIETEAGEKPEPVVEESPLPPPTEPHPNTTSPNPSLSGGEITSPQPSPYKGEEEEEPVSVVTPEPVEVVEQKPEPVVEEIQPPNPLVRGNNTPLSSPLDAISLAFKNNMARARELLVKARISIQIKKKKKLEKVMNLFLTKKKIKNSDVRDLLHIADETATVYLNILKKEGKIQPNGKGVGIYYTKM
jgi:hypothetical protein